ncbi:Oxoglutarate/iron-dependent dioxygenase [Artemisia annua]|uniref:Oxoglutarate/iron-dependent dioxygenase n=1 Tax=Artemisia annua TaxID=35608 RepID=A0A2U1Q4M7_ARTAN|nr:Oxoglutarate/iron-dependent dioxygenase [Artemisia annua]
MEASDPLKRYKVGSVPTVYYIPDFISDTDQTQLLNKIYTAPVSKWKSLKNRRLQDWGGIVHGKGLLPQDLPSWLTKITEKISEESSLYPSAINHVLINEYLPNQGIMPHQDGPAYFPVVAILSLGSPVVMDFTPHYLHGIKDCEIQPYDTAVNATEVLKQQSAVETHDEDLKAIHRSNTRVSLTCRVVSKVHKNLFRF